MLAISPLFCIVGTALLIASYTFAAPLSHSPANSIELVVTPTHFRLSDATTTHRVLTAVAKDRAPNPGEEKYIKSTTGRFPAVVAKDHALNLRKDGINPTTNPITTLLAKDAAQSPGKEDIVNSKPDASPASANIQYHAIVKREVLGPFLYAPLVPSSFDIAEEEWYKKNKKNQDGQVQLDNSLEKKAKGGRTKIEGDAKG